MGYPTLLFPLDDDARAGVRLGQAIAFARRVSSHLVGVSCRRPAPNVAYEFSGLRGIDPLTIELERFERLASERENVFLRRCDAESLASFECVVEEEEIGRPLARRARTADLVLMGQPDPDDAASAERRAVLNDVLIHGSAPVLLLPYAGAFDTIGERILLAWDDSREAARAAASALPLLTTAREVHIVEIDRAAGESGAIAQEPLAAVTQWLARHGVKARARVVFSAVDPGNAILSHAADVSADLLVMGAWGQSRLAERVLGGATRTVLESMTVPVLTAH